MGTIGFLPLAAAAAPHPCLLPPAQADRTLCIADAPKSADLDFDRAYRDLGGRLDANGKRNLVAAERAWLGFRDRECDLRTGYDTVDPARNGTLAPYRAGDCRLDLMQARTIGLRRQRQCPGGDLSCSE